MEGKKTLGGHKIPIEKIQHRAHLLVAISKQRKGLFKKAAELTVVCGAEIALLVQSPRGKMFTFGSPSVESILRQFQMGENSCSYWDAGISAAENYERSQYMEVLKKLEMEKGKAGEIEDGRMELGWDKEIEGMGVEELGGEIEVLESEVGRYLEERKRNQPKGKSSACGIEIQGSVTNTTNNAAADAVYVYPEAAFDEFNTQPWQFLGREEDLFSNADVIEIQTTIKAAIKIQTTDNAAADAFDVYPDVAAFDAFVAQFPTEEPPQTSSTSL